MTQGERHQEVIYLLKFILLYTKKDRISQGQFYTFRENDFILLAMIEGYRKNNINVN